MLLRSEPCGARACPRAQEAAALVAATRIPQQSGMLPRGNPLWLLLEKDCLEQSKQKCCEGLWCELSWAVVSGKALGMLMAVETMGWVAPLPLGAQLPGGMFLLEDGALSLDVPHKLLWPVAAPCEAEAFPPLWDAPFPPPGSCIHLTNEFAEFAALSGCLQEKQGVKSQPLFLC